MIEVLRQPHSPNQQGICLHESSHKLICVSQVCQSPNIIFCQKCFTFTHLHERMHHISFDIFQQMMTPYRKLQKTKQELEEQMDLAFQKKKVQIQEFLDKRRKDLLSKYLESIKIQELELLGHFKQTFLTNDKQKAMKIAMSSYGGIELNKHYQKLQEFSGQIGNISSVFQMTEKCLSRKRNHNEVIEEEGEIVVQNIEKRKMRKRRKKNQKEFQDIEVIEEVPEPESSLPQPQPDLELEPEPESRPKRKYKRKSQIASPSISPLSLYHPSPASRPPISDSLRSLIPSEIAGRVNPTPQNTICLGFQAAISTIDTSTQAQILRIEIQFLDKNDNNKFASRFFEKLEVLKESEILELKIYEQFVMFQFLCETLGKSLCKLGKLEMVRMTFRAKPGMHDYLLGKLEKKIKKKNIFLNINESQ